MAAQASHAGVLTVGRIDQQPDVDADAVGADARRWGAHADDRYP